MSLKLAKPSTCVLDLAIPRVGGVVGLTKSRVRLGFAKSSTRMLNFANLGWAYKNEGGRWLNLQKGEGVGVRFAKVVGGWTYQNEEHGGQIYEGVGWLDLPK